MGIRPENISQQQSHQSDALVESTVDLVEPMGAEFYVYLAAGTHPYIARMTHLQQDVSIGQRVSLYFRMNQAHYFETETEKSLFFSNGAH